MKIGLDALFRREHMFQIGRCFQFEKFIPHDVRQDNDLISGIFDSLSYKVKVLLWIKDLLNATVCSKSIPGSTFIVFSGML